VWEVGEAMCATNLAGAVTVAAGRHAMAAVGGGSRGEVWWRGGRLQLIGRGGGMRCGECVRGHQLAGERRSAAGDVPPWAAGRGAWCELDGSALEAGRGKTESSGR
jgi:hypothetical protein